MRIGMNMLLWTDHVTEAHYGIFEKLKKKGFEGVEIPLGNGTESHYLKIGRQLEDLHLGATCVTSLLEDTNIASSDARIRRAGLDRLRWAVDMAHAMDAELICGPIHSAFAHFTRMPPTVSELEWSIEVLQEAGDYAQQAGVVLAPEALNRFECYLVNTMSSLAMLLDKVNHPYVGAIYDTHHANIEEKRQSSAIETIKHHLKHVHISENDRGTPGRGSILWKDVFGALKKVGYDGWVTIEAFSTSIPAFANSINVWRDYSPPEEIYSEGYDLIVSQWNEA